MKIQKKYVLTTLGVLAFFGTISSQILYSTIKAQKLEDSSKYRQAAQEYEKLSFFFDSYLNSAAKCYLKEFNTMYTDITHESITRRVSDIPIRKPSFTVQEKHKGTFPYQLKSFFTTFYDYYIPEKYPRGFFTPQDSNLYVQTLKGIVSSMKITNKRYLQELPSLIELDGYILQFRRHRTKSRYPEAKKYFDFISKKYDLIYTSNATPYTKRDAQLQICQLYYLAPESYFANAIQKVYQEKFIDKLLQIKEENTQLIAQYGIKFSVQDSLPDLTTKEIEVRYTVFLDAYRITKERHIEHFLREELPELLYYIPFRFYNQYKKQNSGFEALANLGQIYRSFREDQEKDIQQCYALVKNAPQADQQALTEIIALYEIDYCCSKAYDHLRYAKFSSATPYYKRATEVYKRYQSTGSKVFQTFSLASFNYHLASSINNRSTTVKKHIKELKIMKELLEAVVKKKK